MNEQELREIIRLILDAIEEVRRPKKALVLFTGALLGFEESLEALAQLKQSGLTMSCVMTRTAEYLLDRAKIDALGMEKPGPHLISSHDILLIPTCTANTVAKAAYGIADTLATNLISEFLSHGKHIVAISTGADPDCAAKKAFFPLMPAAQACLMRENLARLRALGVRTCDAAGLAECVGTILGPTWAPPTSDSSPAAPPARSEEPVSGQVSPDRLIAAHHIHPLPTGSVLLVRRDAMVTHLAQDLARTRSIRIERA